MKEQEWNDWAKHSKFSMWTVHYMLEDGEKRSVIERADQVDGRLKYLEWSNLEVLSVEKNKET